MRWLKFAAGGLLLLVPFAFVDWRATADALLTAAIGPLALALPLLTSNMPLSAFKWNLLLHVQDASDARMDAHHDAVREVLREIGAEGVPEIVVLNKMDLVTPDEREGLRRRVAAAGGVVTSAREGEGLEALREEIRRRISADWVDAEGPVPAAEGELLARLRATGQVLSEEITGTGVRVRLRLPAAQWSRLRARFGDRAPELFAVAPSER